MRPPKAWRPHDAIPGLYHKLPVWAFICRLQRLPAGLALPSCGAFKGQPIWLPEGGDEGCPYKAIFSLWTVDC